MEKVKRISLVIILILILSMCFLNKTYAAINCNVGISVSQMEVTQGEEFTVNIGISNIQGEKGVLVIGGIIEYNKTLLTLKSRSGANAWSLSYNEATGQFVADRDGFTKNKETVLTLTFTANQTGNATITVKNLVVTDAEEEKSVNNASTSITIKAKNNSANQGGDNQGGNNQGGNNQGGNNQGGNNQGGNNQGGNNQGGNNQGSNNQGGNKPQGGTTNQGSNQGSSSDNNNQNTNTNNEQNTNTTQNTVTGIDQNRIDEENTTNTKPNTVVKDEEPTDYEEVKLHKQTNQTIIIYAICAIGLVAIIIIIFAGKKMIEKAK